MKATKLTVKELQEKSGDVYANITYATSTHLPYPTRPSVPLMSKFGKDSAGVMEYAKELAVYEKEKAIYDEKLREVKEFNRSINKVIEDYIKEESGLNDLPEEKRAKIYSKVYSDKHDDSYYCVYQELCEIVELFN